MSKDKQSDKFDPSATKRAELVAKRAGVSVMTVSRALRGMPNVAAKTRERILAIAEELDYSPSLAARSLRTGKVEIVGFVAPGADSLRGGYNSEMLSGVDYVMAEHGYHVLLMMIRDINELHSVTQKMIKERRVGGLVILGSLLKVSDISTIARLEAPTVILNFSDREPIDGNVSTVCYDNLGGIEKAVRHLAALGHRDVAYVGGTPGDRDSDEREQGFIQAVKKLGLTVNEDWIRKGDFSQAVEVGNQEGDYLMSDVANRPTGIVCASDNIASGLLQSLRRAGKKVPSDVSVVGFDNELVSRVTDPPLTTVNHEGWEIGKKAGEQILQQLLENDATSTRIRLEVSLVIRSSTGPCPAH